MLVRGYHAPFMQNTLGPARENAGAMRSSSEHAGLPCALLGYGGQAVTTFTKGVFPRTVRRACLVDVTLAPSAKEWASRAHSMRVSSEGGLTVITT